MSTGAQSKAVVAGQHADGPRLLAEAGITLIETLLGLAAGIEDGEIFAELVTHGRPRQQYRRMAHLPRYQRNPYLVICRGAHVGRPLSYMWEFRTVPGS